MFVDILQWCIYYYLSSCFVYVLMYLFFVIILIFFFFFFSSRRRHTRYIGDWSSDVCSSDLACCRADAGVDVHGDRQPAPAHAAEHRLRRPDRADADQPATVATRAPRRRLRRRDVWRRHDDCGTGCLEGDRKSVV